MARVYGCVEWVRRIVHFSVTLRTEKIVNPRVIRIAGHKVPSGIYSKALSFSLFLKAAQECLMKSLLATLRIS